ncbi:HipA domain-containing protein [Cupriavidus sp. AcVe19-6a]|nr:HipA domain-containing protein [Cupriavidus sp. AcVe19-1a]MBP0640229.1 HipA domain-containing protein [Cupriavidus sp. AcVe19-6a]
MIVYASCCAQAALQAAPVRRRLLMMTEARGLRSSPLKEMKWTSARSSMPHSCWRRACGIDAPESRLVPLGRQNALLVKRFDREAGGGRIHFASARTLLLAEGIPEEQMSYADIAEVARPVCRCSSAWS